jgi:hypothetical protein
MSNLDFEDLACSVCIHLDDVEWVEEHLGEPYGHAADKNCWKCGGMGLVLRMVIEM